MYSVKLGGDAPLTGSLPIISTDGRWHNVSVSRDGRTLHITHDTTYNEEVIVTEGDSLSLSYYFNEVYAAGRPSGISDSGTVEEGYSGCLQDIRFDEQALPTSGSNEIAGVVFIGEPPAEGCNVGTCFPNPCGSEGNCTEITYDSYQCSCSNGETLMQSSCPGTRKGSSLGPVIGIVISLTLFTLILIALMVIGLSIMYRQTKKWKKTERAAARLSSLGTYNTSLDEFEIHENIYHYDNEDGEDDTTVRRGPPPDNLVQQVSLVSEPDDNQPSPPRPKLQQTSPLGRKRTDSSPIVKRPPTPEINAFIESRVNSANLFVSDLDSLRSFGDEGVLTGASSLSTICSEAGHEPYTITRLRLAGPDFERIADLLEPVLVEGDGDSMDHESGFGGEGSGRNISIALVHSYK